MKDLDGGWFTVGACTAYTALLYCDLPLVRYYPLGNIWAVHGLGPQNGPQMAWYGILAGASLAGIATMLFARLLRLPAVRDDAGFGVALVAVAGCGVFLRGFFA